MCLHASFFVALSLFGALAFFGVVDFLGATALRLLALDLPAFVALVGGTGLAASIFDMMKDGFGRGCSSVVLVCADCRRQV